MLDILQLKKVVSINHAIPIIGIISLNIINQIIWLIEDNKFIFNSIGNSYELEFNSNTHITILGSLLYSQYYYPFIIISILLLVAMVGAIVLTLETNILTKKQKLFFQHQRNNSWI